MTLPEHTIPWYLRQQALLFLAAFNPVDAPILRTETGPETRHYRKFIRFLRGEGHRLKGLRSSDFATLAVLSRRSFVDQAQAVELTRPGLTPSRKRHLAMRDPSFFLEVIDAEMEAPHFGDLPARVREDLCLAIKNRGDPDALATRVLSTHPTGALRNELSLLRFARAFLEQWERQDAPPRVITPSQVTLDLDEDHGVANLVDLRILRSRADPSGSLYEPPPWCDAGQRWRVQLGFLLWFILSGQPDFTRPVRRTNWKEKESCYRPPVNHWYQRLYGLHSGQPAFGDDWLPITDWAEGFLLGLLRWPGCLAPGGFDWIEKGIEEAKTKIGERIDLLERRRGRATRTLMLPIIARPPTATATERPLRGCVVQTAIPTADDFSRSDLALKGSAIRRRHRNHLSAALAAVKRTLALRETHKGSDGRLDWLILPELAVHPNDVRTHLVPFARAYKAVILAGLTYDEVVAGQPLANSALWGHSGMVGRLRAADQDSPAGEGKSRPL